MNKKILFCATVDYHFKAFHLPIMKWFKDQGWEVHVAASGNINLPYTDKKFDIPIQRSPLNFKNIEAYKVLKEIINQNSYKIIHCHTPMGGVLGRLAARGARKRGTKVMYTAHGFHFCKGAPLLNWLLYYPIERGLSRFTDCLITINNEDYTRATSHNFKAKRIEHVHGVGVDTKRFMPIDKNTKEERRNQLGYQKSDFLMFYAAEFNKNKNQQLLIKALAKVKKEMPNARLLLAGKGPLLEDCKKLSENLGVSTMVDFLGFRNDLEEILPICDIAVASSLREGLPVNIMEAMACGLPIVAMENRGHNELIINDKNGFIVKNEDEFSMSIMNLHQSSSLYNRMSKESLNLVENFSIVKVLDEMKKIYQMSYGDLYETKSKYYHTGL